jgi:ATP dependent DNA ligase C terminal region
VRECHAPAGRSSNWVKKTCAQRETLSIAGFALDGGKWDGLYLGRRDGVELIYAGKVDYGFDEDSAKELQAHLKPLIRKTQPYKKHIAHRGKVRRGQGASTVLQRTTGGFVRGAGRIHAWIFGAAGMPCPQCNPSDLKHPPRPPAGTHIEVDKKGWRH